MIPCTLTQCYTVNLNFIESTLNSGIGTWSFLHAQYYWNDVDVTTKDQEDISEIWPDVKQNKLLRIMLW